MYGSTSVPPEQRYSRTRIFTTTDTVEIKPMFHAIEHFSKYIRPGAVRIGCSSFSPDMEMTAAQNPDGSCVLVIMHNSPERKMIQLRVEGRIARFHIPGDSISTIVLE
ncbi:MAG: glycoside hydrolase family 30 beta sandwich domain-containing protein [Oliverpabstia sp.]